ncbi:hypothetical protein, partial [Methylobacterium oryzihabitans]|uniref:hypothetical protein n=1 Tax=Methylobacterium oryzihabitans TaxID=2499852 RepID=UPI001652B4A1
VARPAEIGHRPRVLVQAARDRGRVAGDFPNADILLAAPAPGGRAARLFAELLRRRAGRRGMATDPEADLPADVAADAHRSTCLRQDLHALAALYDHCPTLYPVVALRRGDGLPVNGERLRAALSGAGGSSPALACAES